MHSSSARLFPSSSSVTVVEVLPTASYPAAPFCPSTAGCCHDSWHKAGFPLPSLTPSPVPGLVTLFSFFTFQDPQHWSGWEGVWKWWGLGLTPHAWVPHLPAEHMETVASPAPPLPSQQHTGCKCTLPAPMRLNAPLPICFHGGVTDQVGFVSVLTFFYCPQRRWRSFGPRVCFFVSKFYRHNLWPAQSCASGQRTICFPRGASDLFPWR